MKEEKKRILKLVEEGKLTASEAISLMEKLEEETGENNTTSLSTIVNNSSSSEETKTAHKSSSIGTKLFDLMDTAVKKVKEVDLDLNFGQSFDVNHIFQYKETDFTNLDIHLANGSLNILPWNENDVRVECQAKVYRVDNQEQAKSSFLNHLECGVEGEKLLIRSEKKTMKTNVTLHIPHKQYGKIRIKLFNGPVRGEHLKVNEINAKTTNGVISFSSLKAEKAGVETANGQIKLADYVCDSVEAETINGMIELRGSSRSLDLQSFNGNITAKITEPTIKSVYAKTTTGSVEFTIPREVEVKAELKSNLGSLSADLDEVIMIREKNDTLQKEMYFKANQGQEQTITLFTETKTGSIKLKQA
jgi:DUF4097 and DUF4098 domain-containing protein YvlB